MYDSIVKQNKYLPLIIVAGLILLAGDIVWWRTADVSAEYELQNASVASLLHIGDYKRLYMMDSEIGSIDQQMEQELQILENESQ